VAAYHDVTKAIEDRDKLINQGEEKVLRDERRQQADGLKQEREAEADALKKVLLARANQSAFTSRYRVRTSLDLTEEWRLISIAWREVGKGRAVTEVGEEYHRRREEALALQAVLTDFRLYWDSLSAALSNRDKIIIDADKVPGRRNLWLLPPGPFGLPLPAMMPAVKTQPSDTRGEP
jgi:hypothetical protein